jgi:hypothetical protein
MLNIAMFDLIKSLSQLWVKVGKSILSRQACLKALPLSFTRLIPSTLVNKQTNTNEGNKNNLPQLIRTLNLNV